MNQGADFNRTPELLFHLATCLSGVFNFLLQGRVSTVIPFVPPEDANLGANDAPLRFGCTMADALPQCCTLNLNFSLE